MSRKNIVLFVLSLLVVLCAGCVDDTPCTTCKPDPFAKQNSSGQWVAQPTAAPVQRAVQQAQDTVKKVDQGITQKAYGQSAPTGKQLVDYIGAGNTKVMLDAWSKECTDGGGQVQSKGVATLGCYK